MIQQPTTYSPAPAAEFNAIKINIQGAKVDAPGAGQQGVAQQPFAQPLPVNTQGVGQNINYNA